MYNTTPPQKKISLVFEDDNVSIYYLDSQSNDVVISFNNLTFIRSEDNFFWAQPLFEKLDFSCIGIVSEKKDWFCRLTTEAINAINSITQQHDRRIGYGYSMGAFGTVKYSSLLNLDLVMSLSPQYTIDPTVLEGNDNRYSNHFLKDYSPELTIRKEDLNGDIFVIYDDKFAKDAYHADKIYELDSNNVKLIKQRYTSHNTMQTLSGSKTFSNLLDLVERSDEKKLFSFLKDRKKTRWEYYYYLGLKCFDRKHFKTAHNLFTKSLDLNADKEKNYIMLSKYFLKQNERSKSITYALLAIKHTLTNNSYINLSNVYTHFEMYDEAIRTLKDGWIRFGNHMNLRTILSIYERNKQFTEGLNCLNEFSSDLNELNFYHVFKSRFYFNLKELENSLTSISKAYENEPNNAYIAEFYVKILFMLEKFEQILGLIPDLDNNGILTGTVQSYIDKIK